MKKRIEGPKSLVALSLEYALADETLFRLIRDNDYSRQQFEVLLEKRTAAEAALLSALLQGIGYELKINPHTWEVVKAQEKG